MINMNSKQDFYALRRQSLSAGKLFEDPFFEDFGKILCIKSIRSCDDIKWCRPMEICLNPQFVVKGFCKSNINQGSIGNCWFVAALATLAENIHLFHRVVPRDNEFDEESYAGIFHFR